MRRNQLSRNELSMINKRAHLLANKARVIYGSFLIEAALLALAKGEQIDDEWIAHQVPAIDSAMQELFIKHNTDQAQPAGGQ